MELHPKHILGILEKPFGLATSFIFSLSNGKPLKSTGGPPDGNYKPSPSTHSPITSNPLIPAFLVLLIGFSVLSLSPIRVWLTETEGLPTLAQIFSFSRKKGARSLPRDAENVSVWTKKQSGFYYCEGGTLFGDKPGKIMAQSVALTSGYRPVGGTYCANNQPLVASSNAGESSTLVAENQPVTPVRSQDVEVWGLKQLGFYYCRGDALFGVKPGRLMKQANALADGLEPSYHKCPGSDANLAFTADSSLGTQQSSGPADASPHPMGPSTLISEKSVKTSEASAHVVVWVKKKFGFYYCRNDVLFGNRPGQLMSQSDALTAGYQPSDGRCSDSKRAQATAERLSPREFPPRN